MRCALDAAVRIGLSVALASNLSSPLLAQDAGLKIVVVAGEDAVNIVQQRSAVAPIVEVRDRNDLPVAGAVVTFTMSGGQATFPGGLQTLTVTTNAAGRAAASGITPVSNGTFQISASASYQGQVATTTVTQTNFATVKAAQDAGRNVTNAGSGGGGGLSGAAIGGIAGAAVAGGLVALKAAGGSSNSGATSGTGSGGGTSSGGSGSGGSTGPSAPVTVSGPFSYAYQINWSAPVSNGQTLTCTLNYTPAGTAQLTMQSQSSGAVTGNLVLNYTSQGAGSQTCNFSQVNLSFPGGPVTASSMTLPVTGTTGALTANLTQTSNDSGISQTLSMTFTGSLNGGVVSGTFRHTQTGSGSGLTFNGNGSFPMTLR